MKPIVIDKDGEIINATDWKAKTEKIIEELGNTVFSKFQEQDLPQFDEMGNPLPPKKKEKFYKNQIAPTLTPMQVTSKLNRLLRIYKPMSFEDAKTMDESDFREAYIYYCDLISYINEYVVYMPSKQLFSGFCSISVDTYNDLLADPNFSETFKSFEDSFVDANFASAQAGIVDSRTTVAKLQTKDAGHNLVKNPEFVALTVNNKVDKQQVNLLLDKYSAMTKQIGDKK